MRNLILAALLLIAAAPLSAQTAAEAQRNATREQVRTTLATGGARPDVAIAFRQSDKNPYSFVGSMTALPNADSFEVIVGVTDNQTLSVRLYPHYHRGYVNIDKVREPLAFRTRLLRLNDENFFFWGADKAGDVFAGYTITLESGFPREALTVVLRSIRLQDKFVGEMRPLIDGSAAPK